jgi:hypothetical protein
VIVISGNVSFALSGLEDFRARTQGVSPGPYYSAAPRLGQRGVQLSYQRGFLISDDKID